jgi:hypothetical protein
VCSTRVGEQWIDLGTNCRSRSSPNGVSGALAGVALNAFNPAKVKFDRDHVYSKAPEAARKRDIDLQIIADDYSRGAEITFTSEGYLKQLIRLGSNMKQQVSAKAKKIQFFIIRGGAEGFLSWDMAGEDASNVVFPGSTTSGATSPEFRFDNNDLMAVFDAKGSLIGSALLRRPIQIGTRTWTEGTANAIYDAWHNKAVSIYRNTRFRVPYLGLVVDDGMKKRGWVDMHKEEETNGCIFIVDPATPEADSPDIMKFEPKLIKDVLVSIGKTPEQVKGMIRLGIMRVVDIK